MSVTRSSAHESGPCSLKHSSAAIARSVGRFALCLLLCGAVSSSNALAQTAPPVYDGKLIVGFNDAILKAKLASSTQRKVIKNFLLQLGVRGSANSLATSTLPRLKQAIVSIISCSRSTSLTSCSRQTDNWMTDTKVFNPLVSPTVALATAEIFKRAGLIAYIEPNHKYATNALPNDTYFPFQYSLNNTAQIPADFPGAVVDVDINAPEAWERARGTGAAIIAVIDSGATMTHFDLMDNLYINAAEFSGRANVDDDGDGYIDNISGCDFDLMLAVGTRVCPIPIDTNGHGTSVAGIIGARGNDGAGITGALWRTRLLPLRIGGSASAGDLSLAASVAAMTYVVERRLRGENIRVVNASYGSSVYSETERRAIEALGRHGVLFVAAAGNGGADGIGDNNDLNPVYPASYDLPNIVSVANIDWTGRLDQSSNFGTGSVDLAAPGTKIAVSTADRGLKAVSGTSFSAPLVSAAAALAWEVNPSLTVEEARSAIVQTVKTQRDVPALSTLQTTVTSRGMLNLEGVVLFASYLRSPTWRNPRNQYDVDNNGFITPLDALLVIIALNAGSGPVDDFGRNPPPNGEYIDVNGDGSITPLDALLVINALNSGV